ncbi:isoprenyl transferase [Oceanobacillus picturae]|uniref:Isoprenyl transferase n=1 Tax=Oceanobacillus picturae TaxID=171693 RepID=A0A0U9H7B4_9BACI|nr:isoprenyl transferase [Oceanobacillus picturae]
MHATNNGTHIKITLDYASAAVLTGVIRRYIAGNPNEIDTAIAKELLYTISNPEVVLYNEEESR